MKILKKVCLFTILILICGCTTKSSALKASYEKMEVGTKKNNGYILNLHIYGNNNGKQVNEILKITNYMNKTYEIIKNNVAQEAVAKDSKTISQTSYIKDNKTYVADKNGIYQEIKTTTYKNPTIYLEGLVNTSSVSKSKEEKEGNIKYTVYNVIFEKKIIQTILKDTILSGMKVTSNVNGKVYIDKDGYVHRIIYEINDITINANYSAVNKVYPIYFSINK